MKPTIRDYLQLHFVVLIFGFTAILGVLISVHSLSLVFFRTLLSSTGLFILLKIRKTSFSIEKGAMIKILLTGSIVTCHWVLFFLSAKVSTVAICLAGFSTQSLWTSFLEPLVAKKKMSILEVLLGAVVIAGLYLIFLFEFNHFTGLMLGIGSAVMGALFSVINGQFTKKFDAPVITFYEMIGAAITSLIILLVYSNITDEALKIMPQGFDWLWLSILAFVCTVFAFAETIHLARKFTIFAMNLTINLEPVYGIIFAFVIFGEKERMTTGFYLGTLVILGSVLAYPLLMYRKNKRQQLS